MFQFSLRATTVFSRNSHSLLDAIKTRLAPIPGRTHVLFALSVNASDETLETVPKLWESSVGCLTAPWPSSPEQISCSILEIPFGVGTPFISRIVGRPPVQVGRYHAMRKTAAEDEYDSSSMSYNRAMGQTGDAVRAEEYAIPEGLNPIIQNMPSLVYFSDPAPEGLISSLDYYYPNSIKSGLFAASTPFVTGHPVTMFYNGKVVTSGAVGIGMFPQFESIEHGYQGLDPISDSVKVTSSQGNLVHTLDNLNPSRLLTSAIASHPSASVVNAKEEDFYLGLLAEDSQSFEKVYTITSGDPSRGSLALDGEESPSAGSRVKLLRRSGVSNPQAVTSLTQKPKSITFVTSSKDAISFGDDKTAPSLSAQDDVTILDDVFLAASENGLLLNNPSKGPRTWKSSVEGGWSSMSWLIPPPPESFSSSK